MAPPGWSSPSALARCSPLGAGVEAGRGTTAPSTTPAPPVPSTLSASASSSMAPPGPSSSSALA
eukprot:8531539-Alexandrium_andersonii.AAC.1